MRLKKKTFLQLKIMKMLKIVEDPEFINKTDPFKVAEKNRKRTMI